MFYNTRWYDPYLNRFLSPDSIIPDPYNPIDYDRYSYVRNNPINSNDPSGHDPCSTPTPGGGCGNNGGGNIGGGGGNSCVGLWGCIKDGWDKFWGKGKYAPVDPASQLPFQTVNEETTGNFKNNGVPDTTSKIGNSNPNLNKIFIPDSKVNQVSQRGWSLESIKQVAANPAMTRNTVDNPNVYNMANGNPVTYYYRPDGHYVVIDDVTNQVVQISDLSDINWVDPMTNQSIQPIQSK